MKPILEVHLTCSFYYTFVDLLARTVPQPTPHCIVVKKIDSYTQLVKKFPAFMDTKGSLLNSQKLNTELYPEPVQSC